MAVWETLKNPWNKHIFSVVLLLLLSSFLLLYNLGDGYLWQDEAETALVGKTILEHGVPMGFDDKNSFSQQQQRDISENGLWRWHPWLPFYVTAASFAVLGESTFSARLPFALAGIASVLMLYFLTFHIVKDRRTAFLTALFLVLCVAFLLFSTQARYYSLSILFSLSGMLGYFWIIKGKRYGMAIFIVSSVLLLNTHYIYCASLFLAILVYALLYERNRLKPVIIAMAIVSFINIPALIWYAGIERAHDDDILQMKNFTAYLSSFMSDLLSFTISGGFFLVLIILAVFGTKKYMNQGKNIDFNQRLLIVPILFSIITITMMAIVAEEPYFRYLAPVVPVVFIIAGVLMKYVMMLNIYVALAVFAFWVYTGDMNKYMEKLNHEYRGPMEGIIGVLNEFAEAGDTVAIPYGDLPVKFYTDLYVIGANAEKSFESSATAQWIIIRHNSITKIDAAMNLYLVENMDRNKYRVAEIDFPDLPYQNREVPSLHYFTTPVNAPKVRILRRVE